MSNYTDNIYIDDPNHVWSKLLQLVPTESTVLDIGCSSGNLGQVLIEKKKCVVDGVELDPNDAKLAAKKLRKVWVGNIEKPEDLKPIKPGSYDILILADVLEHLVDPVAALEHAKKLLKPGGAVVFSIPNMAHVSIRLALLEGSFRHTETGVLDKTHLHFYDIEEVRRIFRDAGMTLEKVDTSPYPYSRALIRSRLSELGLTPSEKAYDLLTRPDASAFQYVGKVVYKPTDKKGPALPPVKQSIENDTHHLGRALESKEAEIEAQVKRAEELEAQIASLNHQLADILHSKLYRVSQRAVKPYRTVRGAFKSRKPNQK